MSQTGKNVVVAYKVEATLNTAPGATGAKVLRLTASPGLSLRKEPIRSNEIRPDQLTQIARHGSRMVDGSYSGELSEGSFDEIFQAIVRSTATALVAVTQATASLASITFGTNTVLATSTSAANGFLDAGFKVGDIFTVTGTSGPNEDLNAKVLAVATHTLTCQASAFTAEATAITSFSLDIGKKLINGTTPTKRSFYIDQYNQDIDLSTVFGGCRWTSFSITGSPNGMAEISLGVMGMSATALATGTSPYFTSPTQYTSRPLVFADAVITFGGTSLAVATAFNLTYELTAQTLPVIGSDITPNVFDNEARLSGSITVLREDLARLSNFIDEDELELHILLQEPGTDPRAYISFFIPLLKLMGNDAPLGSDGAMVETLPWEAGVKTAATGYDAGMISIVTSAT